MAKTRARQVVLDEGQKGALTRIRRSGAEEARRAQRAAILLMAEEGHGGDALAVAVSLNKNSVRNALSKFHSLGLDAALGDLAKPGRPLHRR